MERWIQRVKKGKWEEAMELEKQFSEMEVDRGYPPKRWYRPIYGSADYYDLVWEREWEDLATLEKTNMEQPAPDVQAKIDKLMKRADDVYESTHLELYWVVPPPG